MSKHADEKGNSGKGRGGQAQLQKVGKRIWLFVGGAGVVIALITGVLQINEQVSKRPSSTDRVELEATPLRLTSGYALPVDAPFEEMPLTFVPNPYGVGHVCSPEVHDWLGSHGREYVTAYRISLRSTADSGARITVKDFSAKGTLADQAVPLIQVACAGPGVGAVISSQQGTLQTRAGSTAVFTDLSVQLREAFNQPPGGSPVLYELEPGEPAIIDLMLTTDEDFEGSLVATIASGEDAKEVVIPLKGLEEIFLPSFSRTTGVEVRIVPPKGDDPAFIDCVFAQPTGAEKTYRCDREDLASILANFSSRS